MSLQQQLSIAESSEWVLQLAIACIALFVGIRLRQVFLGVVIGVVAAWVAVNIIRNEFTIPLREAVWAAQDSAPESDGDLAGNVALLFFGWVLPLAFLLVVLFFRYLWGRIRRFSIAPNVA